MVLEQLVDRLAPLELLAQLVPPHLEHLAHRKVKHLLDEVVHPRAQRKHPAFPRLEFGVRRAVPPRRRLEVFGPRVLKDALELAQAEEVPEDHLVVRDGFPREDERERELDRVVEVEDVPT